MNDLVVICVFKHNLDRLSIRRADMLECGTIVVANVFGFNLVGISYLAQMNKKLLDDQVGTLVIKKISLVI